MKLSQNQQTQINSKEDQSPSRVFGAMASLALSMLLSSLGISIANVALPTLAQYFSASFQQVQWVVIAYLLAITVMIVSVGRLGDLVGRRRVFVGGILLFTVASVLSGLAPTLWMLVLARIVQGLAAAILMALSTALVRETVAAEKTGSAMGLLGTMSAIGTALGPSLGGFLIAGLDWRAIFFVMVPIGLLNLLLAYRYLPEPEPGKVSARFDGWGTLLLGLSLTAYAFAVTVNGGRFDQLNAILILAALIAVGLFIVAQTRVVSPLVPLAAFRNRPFNASLLANAIVSTVMMSTLVVGPFFLSRSLGLSEVQVGLVLSTGPIFSTLSGVPAGRLVDWMGGTTVVIAGLTAMVIGVFALAWMPSMYGIAGYIGALAVLTPGYQMFQAANNTVVMMNVAPDQRGVISGILSLSRNLGLVTGASAMGAVFAYAVGANDISSTSPETVAYGMQFTFMVASGLILIALVAMVLGRAAANRTKAHQDAS